MRYNTIKNYVKTKTLIIKTKLKTVHNRINTVIYIYCNLSQDIYASHFLKSFGMQKIPRNGIKCHDIYLLEWKKSPNSSFETVHYIYFAVHIKECTWKIKRLSRFFIASDMKDPRWWVRFSEWVHHGKGYQIFSYLFSISLYKQRWLVSEEIFFFFPAIKWSVY